jgi:hypothetical protein
MLRRVFGRCRFDLSAHVDWQLIGAVDYTATPEVNFHLG